MAIGNWQLILCGIDYNTTSVEEREPLQLGRTDMAGAHSALSEIEGVMEATIVSTCNRIEFYFVARNEYEPFGIVTSFYKQFSNIDIKPLMGKFYILRNNHAAKHLFRVASGIESMVLGENQIMGQLKEAYSSACAVKSAGKIMHRLFHQAFRIGKQARSDTEMGKGACSVSSAAIELLKTRLDQFDNPKILFIGINQMIALAATGLVKLDCRNFIFANRTASKAKTFAEQFQAEGFGLENISSLLARADIAITCTGAKHPIITRELIDRHPESLEKPLLILDMAIPRDTDLETDKERNLEVLDLEAVQEFVKDQQQKRQQAIPQVESIIEQKIDEFRYWFNHVRHEPLYNGLTETFEQIRREEMLKLSEEYTSGQLEEIAKATKRITDRLLQIKVKTDSPKNTE
ncbi:MAG: glutamyl-tRNA reductase [Candidatus Zixiibacteriota bacterium]